MTNQRKPLQPRLVSKPFFTRLTATLLLLPAISVASDVPLQGLALISAALAEEVEQAVPEPGDEVRLVHVKDVVMGDSHYWNTVVHSGYNKLMTHGDYQYAVYWNSEFRLTLGRRHLQTDEVVTTVFPYTGYPHDVHNVPVLGFSPQDGRLHLAWHMRGAPGLPASNYVVSNPKLISDPPDTMTTDDFRPRVEFVEGAFVTYPRFFNDPDGRLFQIFRNGGAASADYELHRYDAENHSWVRVGMVLSREGQWPQGVRTRGAYLYDPIFDATGRLHLAWNWASLPARNAVSPTSLLDRHHHNYAYSDDGGITWHNNAGEPIADLGRNRPIRIDTPGITVIETFDILEGSMTLDANRQPHLSLVGVKASPRDWHVVHVWRTPDGAWHRNFAVDPKTERPTDDASYSSHFLAYNGDIAIDRDQNLFVTFPRPTSEVFVVQSHLSTPTKRVEYPITGPLFDDLRPVSRERFAFFRWEGKVDRPRWERDQIFSLPAVVRKDGAFHFVIKDYVLQKPEPAP